MNEILKTDNIIIKVGDGCEINSLPRDFDEELPSIEEEILYETKYQTLLLEMGGM